MQSLIRVVDKILSLLGEHNFRYRNETKSKVQYLKYSIIDRLIQDKWKPLYFMYMDESINQKTNVSCISSIYFPSKMLLPIRKELFAIHRKIKDRIGLKYYGKAIEIHGKDLLKKFKEVDDEFRYMIFEDMVKVINKYKIRIYRIGYSNAKEIGKFIKTNNEKFYGLHMTNFCHLLEFLTKQHRINMVMDSVNNDVVEQMSRMIYLQTSDTLMYPDVQLSFIIKKPFNILESVVYVDSKYSEFMQLSDVIGYLLNKMDFEDLNKPVTEFGSRLISIGRKLNSKLVYNRILKLNMPKPNFKKD